MAGAQAAMLDHKAKDTSQTARVKSLTGPGSLTIHHHTNPGCQLLGFLYERIRSCMLTAIILKVHFPVQELQHHLTTCQKDTFSSPILRTKSESGGGDWVLTRPLLDSDTHSSLRTAGLRHYKFVFLHSQLDLIPNDNTSKGETRCLGKDCTCVYGIFVGEGEQLLKHSLL